MPDQEVIESCWLCEGLGAIAIHDAWTARRGKPLWTAHGPSSANHPVRSCPACPAPQGVEPPAKEKAAPELPVLAREDVTLLFDWHYYDGPLEGALEWGGTRYWFSADPDHHDFGQILRLMTLSAEDWARVDHSQALFEANIGTHTRYDRATQRRDLNGIKNCCATYDDPNAGWMPEGEVVATVRMWEATRDR